MHILPQKKGETYYPSLTPVPLIYMIKCNGQKPKCINCQTYEKDCVYEPVPDVTKAAGRQRHQRTKTRSVKARTESPLNHPPVRPAPPQPRQTATAVKQRAVVSRQ
ncbi:pathway-specific regulatory protein nit-4 [Fusarium fujikuroi]|nr:pathway-specific regulatory protein nit-4 [Fusarium fujikuroi]